jgi:CHAT domain-containing protein
MIRRSLGVFALVVIGASGLILVTGSKDWEAWRLSSISNKPPYRLVRGQLASAPYRPFRASTPSDDTAYLQLRADAASFAQNASHDRIRGDALLLVGNADPAVEMLQRASAGEDALAWSDLSVALIARGASSEASEPLLDALIAARRAISLDPTNAAARFNAALALEELGLTAEAAHEYGEAARVESDPGWAAEASGRTHTLQVKDPSLQWKSVESQLRDGTGVQLAMEVIARESGTARRIAEWNYLSEWGAARLAGKDDVARENLNLARVVASALVSTHGERLLADTIAAIDRAEAKGTAIELAKGHVAYDEARRLLRARDAAGALEKFDAAIAAFVRAGSPMDLMAKHYAAGGLYSQGQIEATLEKVAEIERADPAARGYRVAAAQYAWHQGICFVVGGRYADAVRVFERSRKLASDVRDALLTAQYDSLTAEAVEYLGQSAEAWRLRRQSLRALSAQAQDQRKTVTLMLAANLQLAQRQWRRCVVIHDHAVPVALRLKDPVLATYTLAQRAIALEELGEHAAAAADRDRAAIWLQKITEPSVHQRLAVEVEIARGVAVRGTSPADAVAHFDRAIRQFTENGEPAHLPRLYLERGRAYEALGDVDRYHSDLMSGLKVVESWAANVADLEQRAALNIWSETIRRDAVDLALRTGDVASAFEHVERERSVGKAASLAHVTQSLASDAAIVEFVRTTRGTIAFVVRRNDARAVRLPVSFEAMAAAADRFRRSSVGASAELHRMLIAPIQPLVAGAETLLVVPAREMTGIPFGALYDQSRARLLIEDVAVLHAASSSDALAASQTLPRAAERVLVVGADDFESETMPRLPHIDRETMLVARAWERRAVLLSGPAAISGALRQELPSSTIVHYAGHIVGEASGSQLLLGDGTLAVADIARLDLSRTRVVVLAACRGVATRTSHSILADAASAFLLAGARTVVASAVDVNDAQSPPTMARLHRFLEEGLDPATAVHRSALLEREKGTEVPSAHLMVVGGSPRLLSQ